MQHLDDGILNALVDGEVPSSELGPIQRHLDSCPECRVRLDETRAFAHETDGLVDLIEAPPMSNVGLPVTPGRGWRTRPMRNLAWAATVVAALGIGYATGNRPFDAPGETAFRQMPLVGGMAVDTPADEAPQPAAAPEVEASTQSRVSETGAVGGQVLAADTRDSATASTEPTMQRRDAAAPIALAEGRANELEQTQPKREAALGSAEEEARRERVAGRIATDVLKAASAPAAPRPESDADRQVRALVSADEAGLRAADRRSTVSFSIVTLKEASTLLGGSLRLIDGLVPDRLEASGTRVRVIYPWMGAELVLEQRQVADSVVVELTGPPGVPADSLAMLRARIR